MPPEAARNGPARSGQRLGRKQRLVSTRLFDEAYEQGRKFVGRHMILFVRSGPGASLRLGVVTGRKMGGAVARARARRRLREAFRRNRAHLHGDVDMLLLARAGVHRASWPAVVADFTALVQKAGLWSDGATS